MAFECTLHTQRTTLLIDSHCSHDECHIIHSIYTDWLEMSAQQFYETFWSPLFFHTNSSIFKCMWDCNVIFFSHHKIHSFYDWHKNACIKYESPKATEKHSKQKKIVNEKNAINFPIKITTFIGKHMKTKKIDKKFDAMQFCKRKAPFGLAEFRWKIDDLTFDTANLKTTA